MVTRDDGVQTWKAGSCASEGSGQSTHTHTQCLALLQTFSQPPSEIKAFKNHHLAN